MDSSWAFIYVAPDADAATDRVVVERGGLRTALVAVPDPSASAQVARELVDDGARLVELCGVHGPVWTAKVIEAVGDRVPVGAVNFGAESTEQLAAFQAQYSAEAA